MSGKDVRCFSLWRVPEDGFVCRHGFIDRGIHILVLVNHWLQAAKGVQHNLLVISKQGGSLWLRAIHSHGMTGVLSQ